MQTRHAGPVPEEHADDPRLMSRALGVMLVCAGLAVSAGITLSPPARAALTGLYAVGLIAVVLGTSGILGAPWAKRSTAHALFASGATLICFGTYFTGAATGLYGVLLVWLAIFAAVSSFSTRAVTLHIAWMMLASGATLAMIGPSPGAPHAARWTAGGILLVVTAIVTGRRAARRRASEAQLRSEIRERERLQRELEHLADHDPLTGVANRRRLEQDLDRELAAARCNGTPLCVATIDLDDLKTHNDTYGHAAGDRLLQHVAHTWSAALLPTDLLARTGGDEFVIVLPGRTLSTAKRLVDDLRQAVAPMCGCSAGAACWDGRETASDLQVRADLAMYEAKAGLSLRRGRRSEPGDQRVGESDVGSLSHPSDISVWSTQDGSRSGDGAEYRELPAPVVARLD